MRVAARSSQVLSSWRRSPSRVSLSSRRRNSSACRHDVRMRVECAARKADVRRMRRRDSASSGPRGRTARRSASRRRVSCRMSPCRRGRRNIPARRRAPGEIQRRPHRISARFRAACTLPAAARANACTGRGRTARCAQLSISVESPGALLLGCSACSGLTSTQAMSLRRRNTRSVSFAHVPQRVGFVAR